MVDELSDLGLKEFGEFTTINRINSVLDQVVSDRLESIQAYGFVSLELDDLAHITQVDSNKFFKVLLKDDKYEVLYKGLNSVIARIYKGRIEPNVLKSLVKSTFILDSLNSMVHKAGSTQQALDYISEKFGVEKNSLALSLQKSPYIYELLVNPTQVSEALKLNRELFGIESGDMFSLSMLATTSMLLGVRDQFRDLIGFGEFIYDRNECFYIFNICVRTGFEGYGVGAGILKKAISLYPHKRFWGTLEEGNINSLRRYLTGGFTITEHLKNYFGEGLDQLLVQRPPSSNINQSQGHVGGNQKEGLHLSLNSQIDLEEYVTNQGCEISGLINDDGGIDLIAKKHSISWKPSPPLINMKSDFMDLSAFIASGPHDAIKASNLEKQVQGVAGEEPHTLIRIMRTGLLICVKDSKGNIVGDVPLVFDINGGLFCHGVAVAPQYDEYDFRYYLMDFVEQVALAYNKNKVWTTCDTRDFPPMIVDLNWRGFSGKRVLFDYYGRGKHRMVIEKRLGFDIPSEPNWHNLPFIGKESNFSNEVFQNGSVLVYAHDYKLIDMLFNAGFSAKYLVTPDRLAGRFKTSESMLVLSKKQDVKSKK